MSTLLSLIVAEMEVTTLRDKLAVLDANAPVGTLIKRLAEVKKNTLGNIFSRVEVDALVKTLSR